MKKIIFFIILIIFISNKAFASNVKIDEDLDIVFNCKFEKIIKKNLEFNYKVFLSNEADISDLENLKIISKKPNNLEINGLSNFLTDTTSLEVKIANKEIVLFKGFDENKNYSESGIINRKSGELVHEVTREIKSETPEKDITFYNCTEKNRVV